MYTIELLNEAIDEVKDACDWYESKQSGLANKFLKELDYYFQLIETNPLQFQIRFSELYRFATLKTFPYFIVFRVEASKNIVYVISVFHTSRNPKKF